MMLGKNARDCDNVVGQKIQVTLVMLSGKKMQVTATMLMEIYASNCSDVEGQKSKGL